MFLNGCAVVCGGLGGFAGGGVLEDGEELPMDAMSLGREKAQDVLASLEAGLRPVELYAVRVVEESRNVDVEAVASQALESIRQEEWQLYAIEKR